MARQARVEYPGALHHVRARGNRREAIFYDDVDRLKFLELLGEAVRRYGWIVAAWVLMTNHFHLMLETPQPTLSDGMRWLLGTYACWFNLRHGLTGHLFGERFRSNPVEKETYARRLARYIVRNPVKANMFERPEDYVWSSYRATAGLEPAPEWFAAGYLQPYFGSEETWRANYVAYVHEALAEEDWIWKELKNQIYLGSEAWVASLRKQVEAEMLSDVHPHAQRWLGRPAMPKILRAVAHAFGISEATLRTSHGGAARRMAAWLAWYEGLQKLRTIAASLRLQSSSRARALVRECEAMMRGDPAMQRTLDAAFAALR
jgi:REP element-mobilizing transposase RayT